MVVVDHKPNAVHHAVAQIANTRNTRVTTKPTMYGNTSGAPSLQHDAYPSMPASSFASDPGSEPLRLISAVHK
jgi:hypothetical protein